MTNALLNQVNKSVEKGRVQDQTEDKGGYTRELIPKGKYPARFIGYVEIGNRDGGEWQGKKKPDQRKAYLYFQLLSKKLGQEIEVDGEKKVVYPVHREMVDVKQGEKANLTKLFNRMVAGRSGLTHIAQMLGEPFRVGIEHRVVGEGANARTYENARSKDEGWLVGPPVVEVMNEDGDVETKKLNVAEAREPLKLLLWDDPTPEQWDSIKGRPFEYGKGDAKKTFDGGYLQYICINEALDFNGSALEGMLAEGGLPDMLPEDPLPEDPEDDDGVPEQDAGVDDGADGSVPEDDPLAGISDLDDEIPF